jgi:hypothetical protein
MGTYKNVMELLVEEEVVRQFNALPPRVSAYINQVEWVAHALNQLPPLYATSEKGLTHQVQQGKAKHGSAIKQAVQRALAAIRRDPLRSSTPLRPSHTPSREVLSRLRFLLRNERLEWHMLPVAVEQALEQAGHGHRPVVRTPAVYAPVRGSSPFPNYETSTPAEANTARQSTSQSRASQDGLRQSNAPQPTSQEGYGWDDPLYNPR